MYHTQEPRQQGGWSPSYSTSKMGISAITHMDGPPSRKNSEDVQYTPVYGRFAHPQTPPDSNAGSPKLKPDGSFSSLSRESSPIPRLIRFNSTHTSLVRLPSIEEFDLGVEALARSYGPTRSWTPPSPRPSMTRRSAERLPSVHEQLSHDKLYGYQMPDPYMHGATVMDYPSPPPDAENRHINQKYTQEEGDFIIYLWHDKKLKWQRIKQDFATMFGRTPERTVQGLQAWYYRMNQRIPVWDQDGWLVFDNEDDIEPKHIAVKCRDRESQDKPTELLGLAQRYPERAMNYSWVDAELKHKSQDWAAKRNLQYRDRKARRKRKEQRRLKL